ncbi:hypothetical protein [Candidatus Albibeggiatoa sp. nov. NOAA]|uniref:hypothetical protein n=1 Tax=Candidatus Albibeggiatoa sp. nov. NOAA TaxID=3162724 RepID=UPI0033004E84|nr:hypothetical protein [Thiotrichaceae bacterium]
MDNKIVWIVFGITVGFLASTFFEKVEKQERVIKEAVQCTYAVLVSDSQTNRVLSGVKVNYEYNDLYFVGYSDSEGYYKITFQCDTNIQPLVIIKAEKVGYKIYSRHITQNLQRVEQVRLKKLDVVSILIQKADNGDIDASNKLAGMYKTGDGVPKDYEKAFYNYKLGAEMGDKEAQTQLGIMFEKGQFVKRDDEKAIEWYRKAANQGYPEAQTHLGRMIYYGKGTEKDETEGMRLLLLASNNGYVQADSVIDEINRAKRIQKPISEEEVPTKEFYDKSKKSDENSNTEFSCKNVTEIPQAECEELVNFYHSTGGDNWFKKGGWLQTSSPCSWFGIECENGSVISLLLFLNNLNGEISSFSALTQLKILSLESNQLSGTIPDFSNLTQLRTLSLAKNRLSGTIPDFSNLTKLGWLNLSSNNLCHNPNINYEEWVDKISVYPICK